ncbi:MFS transporter [Chondromyces apiculatus]|uniref:Transporter, putative n=1 Tax=Chondromyces apiculatus DSM 436 TaxID=1192034 RepID=A0A017TB22_9BACT|nr:MFS transporter [Chondromyces apiculatus]EYF05826.1 transporter, putative [Chondromyces apiculatus DSM 436]
MVRAFRHRNYRVFFTGQLISLIGTWMQSVAQAWLVYRLTGSALLLGAIGFAGQFPVFLLATVGGAVADRWSRRAVLVVTQAASMSLALVLAGLTLSHLIRIEHVFVMASLLGVVNAFDIPTRQSFVVEMVGRDDLPNAIALNSSVFNGARIVGPAVAAVLVDAIGEGYCFLANGLSFVAVITGLLALRLPPRPAPPKHASAFAAALEGFRFVARTQAVRALLLLLGLVSLTAAPYLVLLPAFAARVLQGGPRAYGLLMVAAGLGAVTAALTLAARQKLEGLGRWVVCACACLGVSLVLFSLSRIFWLSWLLLLPAGFGMMVYMAGTNTLVQSIVPDALRGRVMAVYSMMFMGLSPMGALLAGWLADRIGPAPTVTLGGSCCLVGAAVFAVRLTKLGDEARAHLLGAQGAPPSTLTPEMPAASTDEGAGERR